MSFLQCLPLCSEFNPNSLPGLAGPACPDPCLSLHPHPPSPDSGPQAPGNLSWSQCWNVPSSFPAQTPHVHSTSRLKCSLLYSSYSWLLILSLNLNVISWEGSSLIYPSKIGYFCHSLLTTPSLIPSLLLTQLVIIHLFCCLHIYYVSLPLDYN